MKNIVLSLSAALAVAILPACKPNQPTTESPAKPEAEVSPVAVASPAATDSSVPATPPEIETETAVVVELQDPVAVVNGEPISSQELREAFDNAVKASGVKVADLNADQQIEGYRELLDDLIMDKLVSNAAKDVAVTPEEVDAEIAKIKAQFPSEEEFQKQMTAAGQSPDKLTEAMGKMLKQQKWMESQFGDETKVAEADAKTFYDSNQKEFEEPETVKASHILILVKKDDSEEVVQEKLALAKKAAARAKKGEDFTALAKELSEEPGVEQSGGDLGFFPKDRMVPEFAEVAFNEKVGEISDPVRTEYGWHVIKVTDKKAAGTLPFEEVKEQLTSYLQTDKKRKAVAGVLKKMKDSAKIENTLPAAPVAPVAPVVPGAEGADAGSDASGN